MFNVLVFQPPHCLVHRNQTRLHRNQNRNQTRSKSGTACKCLPTVSTCRVLLRLPVHINSDNEMLAAFKSAIDSENGLDCC